MVSNHKHHVHLLYDSSVQGRDLLNPRLPTYRVFTIHFQLKSCLAAYLLGVTSVVTWDGQLMYRLVMSRR
jgi:hypothetical protein